MPSLFQAKGSKTSGTPREWVFPALPKGIRQIACGRSELFQVRIYTDGCSQGAYPVNFGLYPSVWEAKKVTQRIWVMMARGMNLWEILVALIEAGSVKASIRSWWVYRVDGGWAIKARHLGKEFSLAGPFATAREAKEAVRMLVP